MQKNKSLRLKLKEGEKVIAIIHRNWFYVTQQFFFASLLLILAFSSFWALPKLFPMILSGPLYPLLIFMESSVILLAWIFAFLIFIDYFFDVWILTNKNIINIEQKGLFVRQITALPLEKIDEISISAQHYSRTLLNYGDLILHVHGKKEAFLLRTVSNPFGLQRSIMKAKKLTDEK